jgi:CDGSH-type Zn-finger protein
MCSIARGTKDNDTIPRHWDTAGQRRVEPVLRLTPPHNIRKEKHINMSSKDQQRLCQGISGSQPFCDRSNEVFLLSSPRFCTKKGYDRGSEFFQKCCRTRSIKKLYRGEWFLLRLP